MIPIRSGIEDGSQVFRLDHYGVTPYVMEIVTCRVFYGAEESLGVAIFRLQADVDEADPHTVPICDCSRCR
jgi:hypothetical protein